MRVLNLDPGFAPLGYNDVKHESFRFNGGESNIKLDKSFHSEDEVTVTHRIRNGDDIMLILLANDALKRCKVKKIDLFIPYIPYGRQDRVCDYGEAFSLKVFADIINRCEFANVITVDPHSDVTGALINNLVVYPPDNAIIKIVEYLSKFGPVTLISPDAGSYKKLSKFHAKHNEGGRLAVCTKDRNPITGKLTDIRLQTDPLAITNQNCLIVDDICDGGRTFTEIARDVLKWEPKGLYLYVTHGIFSNGFSELDRSFNRIYTTNSVKPLSTNSAKLTTLNCI